MTEQQIGKAIRKARGTRSARSVSALSSVTRGQLDAVEKAATAYTLKTLLQICETLGMEVVVRPTE